MKFSAIAAASFLALTQAGTAQSAITTLTYTGAPITGFAEQRITFKIVFPMALVPGTNYRLSDAQSWIYRDGVRILRLRNPKVSAAAVFDITANGTSPVLFGAEVDLSNTDKSGNSVFSADFGTPSGDSIYTATEGNFNINAGTWKLKITP